MKSLLSLCLLAILLYACKSEKKTESLNDVLQSIAPPKQEHTIDPAKDNVITGEKGTKVFLPANLFVHKDGSLPTGKVEVVLEEFFSVAEFASNGLSTMSDSLLLETGGMLNIKATADGKELEVGADKSYVVAFPNKTAKEMDLFYGDTTDGKINWMYDPVNAVRAEGGPRDPLLDSDSSLYSKKLHPYSWTSLSENFNWEIQHSDSTLMNYLENTLKLPANSVLYELLNDRDHIRVYVAFDQQGKVVKTYFVDNTPVKYQQPFTDILKSMPAFKTSHISKDILQTRMAFLVVDMHNEIDYKKYKERFDKKYTQYRDKAIQQMAGTELNTYVFSVNRFGWINCDRFWDDSTQKTELWVKSIDTGESQVMAVFENIRSVMQGVKGTNGYTFPNIPIGSPVRLIAIGYKNGKPLLSTKNIKVGKEVITMDSFREFSLKDLEAELNVTPK